MLIEDNAGDVDLTREAIADLPFDVDLLATHDGEQALADLRQAARRGGLPHAIFLDLNLPGMTGHQVLEQLRADPALRDIPVVVITSSAAEKEVWHQNRLRCDDFFTKPLDLDEYLRLITTAARRWLPGA
jgi:two-component system, chemotaxis family, response regulator Rcp1